VVVVALASVVVVEPSAFVVDVVEVALADEVVVDVVVDENLVSPAPISDLTLVI
jgi:hypothetical protein